MRMTGAATPVPTARLYPFQWYWDSVICALGWQTFDEERAWQEMDFLLKGMRADGFLPHILFHKPSDDYFPGPDFWGTLDEDPPGSRVSQPPILSWGYWHLYQASDNKEKCAARLKEIFPRLCQHHLWWIEHRQLDPGLLASIHPWETGMDNSTAWDGPMEAVPEITDSYQRKDITLVEASERPTSTEYNKYLYIVKQLREGKKTAELAKEGPFSVYDLCIISLFHRASKDLVALGEELGLEVPVEIKGFMVNTAKNIGKLWINAGGGGAGAGGAGGAAGAGPGGAAAGGRGAADGAGGGAGATGGAGAGADAGAGGDADGAGGAAGGGAGGAGGYFCEWDCVAQKHLPVKISACFLPFFAGLATKEQAIELEQTLRGVLADVKYGVPSTAADEDGYDSCRYWRGPVCVSHQLDDRSGLGEV